MSRYCQPTCAGLPSEPRAVAKRLARLIEELDSWSWAIAKGQILDDVRKFRCHLQDKLEAEGWTMSYDGGNTLKVREPGHKRAFKKWNVENDNAGQ